ncbi:MAG TPA: nucleotidyltransferase family protein [Candidatus Udaeobacter sp.]
MPESLRQKVFTAQPNTIGAIILAAGASNRMGTPKQLLQFCKETLLRRAALVALGASCQPVIVVIGANAEESRESLHELDVRAIENQQWQSGMSSSIRTGIEELVAVNPETMAAVIILCDQPLVTVDTIRDLVRAHQETNCSIVASRYGNSYGVPALFGRTRFAELRELNGDEGAKAIIKRHFAQAHLLPFPEGEIDIDTPDDFVRLQSMDCSTVSDVRPLR